MKPRLVLILIWLAFLARGAFYATVIPIWEGLDEWAHFAYVHHLTTFGTLPRPEDRASEEISRSLQLVPIPWYLREMPAPAVTHDVYWGLPEGDRSQRESAFDGLPADAQLKPGTEFLYEGKQPPLYYLICAPLLKLAGGASLATRVLLLRLLTVLMVSLVVPLSFAIARRVFGATTPAILIAILLAAMPVLSMTGARIANDGLAIVLFSILALALLRSDPWDWRGCLLIGFTLGAGLLTKAYFVASAPVLVVAGATAIWNASSEKRLRVAGLVSASAILAIAISAWWYVRILGVPGPVWADVAPAVSPGASGVLTQILRMPWWQAVTGALDMHFWFAGWSFLFVRSWIYHVLRWVFLLLLLGGFVAMLRNMRKSSGLPVLWGLYAGFWGAMMYHALVTFMSVGIPSSTGHYLYAVVACEGVLLYSGMRQLVPSQWQDRAMLLFIGLFLLLETYATHFVLMPYYTGLIRHRPDTSLLVFHVSQALEPGWNEILLRLAVHKPGFVSLRIIVLVWGAFLTASAGLFALAYREVRSSRTLGS